MWRDVARSCFEILRYLTNCQNGIVHIWYFSALIHCGKLIEMAQNDRIYISVVQIHDLLMPGENRMRNKQLRACRT